MLLEVPDIPVAQANMIAAHKAARRGCGRSFARSAVLVAAASPLALACSAPVEPDLVNLADVAPGIEVEMRYAGPDNFVGEPIEGYARARCLLTPPAARALAGVASELGSRGLGLRVYDCYRPQRAVDHFVRWAEDPSAIGGRERYYPNVDKSRLFEQGYIARRSGHSRGSTVDLTLVARDPSGATGEVDMGGPFDLFDPSSRTDSPDVGEAARRNRALLRDAMDRGGFENLPEEWWHYTLRDEPYRDRYWDVEVR
jgi:zinc D-Ala-D-Ala dipeptidase